MFDYTMLWQNFGSLLPYSLLAAAILSLWIKRRLWVWGSLLLAGILTGLYAHRLQLIALIPILLLGNTVFFTFNSNKRFVKIICALLSVLFSILLAMHQFPGFQNWEIAHELKLTASAIPFSMYLNFDKPLIGLFILGFGLSYINTQSISWHTIYQTLLMSILACVVLSFLSVWMNYVHFEPKWNDFFSIWALNNLLFVCVAEEAFFRGFIQQGLMRLWAHYRFGNLFALIIASVLFGLLHFQGGLLYIGLATLAGILYGTTYWLTHRIEASIFTHFSVNAVHFLLFTYPALQVH